MKKEKKLIGWREIVSLPEWNINRIKAKVDTGARTSALHVEGVKEIGHGKIQFSIVVDEENKKKKKIIAQISRRGNVRSSTGEQTNRYFVATMIKMGDQIYNVEVSLVDRKNMKFPMLLGRSVLKRNFIVDVSHGNLLIKKEKRKK